MVHPASENISITEYMVIGIHFIFNICYNCYVYASVAHQVHDHCVGHPIKILLTKTASFYKNFNYGETGDPIEL